MAIMAFCRNDTVHHLRRSRSVCMRQRHARTAMAKKRSVGEHILIFLLVASLFLPVVVLSEWGQRQLFPISFVEPIVRNAEAARVDPCLVASVVRQESGYRPQCRSEVGAIGLMQLMPKTAAWIAERDRVDYRGEAQLVEANMSLRLGTSYLAWLIERFNGDLIQALAAYNVGQHQVDEWVEAGSGELQVQDIPFPETKCFVRNVLAWRDRYRRLYGPDLGRCPR